MDRSPSFAALRIAGIYIFLGVGWIVGSDRLLEMTISDLHTLSLIQTYKGWGFVLASGLLIFLLLSRELRRRLQDERMLRDSEQRFRTLFETATDAILIINIEGDGMGKIVAANPVAAEMHGYNLDELLALNICNLATSESVEKIPESVERVIKGELLREETIHRRKDGSVFPIEISAGLLVLEKRKYSLAIYRNISERKQAEQALRESEEKYRVVVDKAREGILVVQDEMVRFVNPRALEIVGRSREELLSRPFAEFIHPDDREMVLDKHSRRIIGEDFQTRYPFKLLDKQGTERWVEIDSALILWERRAAALVFMCDISERVKMDEALKESEERYRTLVEESFDGMFIQKGPKILFSNFRLHAMLGYSAGELEGLDHWMVYHPDSQKLTRDRAMARMRGENVPSQYEVRLLRKDGSSLDGEISAKPVTVKGEPGVLVWVRDVSARKRSEEARRRLATAVEQAAEAVVITDVLGRIQYVNPAFEQISGYVREEVIGRNPRVLRSGEHDPLFYKNLWETITRGEAWTGRFINRRKDGTLYQEDATISPVRDSAGEIVNFVAVKRDITEHLRLSEQLLQAQKMEVVGTLAGGIAHDFNNLLTIINGFTEMILLETAEDDPKSRDLQKILETGHKGAELVQRLLALSKRGESSPAPLDLNRLVEATVSLITRTFPRMIDIEKILEKDLGMIEADSAQVEQVLMNLTINAKEAMPEGGRLRIETANALVDEDYCSSHPGAKPGPHVLVVISDTGIGMGKETMERMFDPFFTTKGWDFNKGTGLGLSVAKGIVEQHGGWILCESEASKGTTFRLYFPVIQELSKSEKPEAEVRTTAGGERILLVDDEELVRDLGTRILERAGYTVITATNGQEALDIYAREQSNLELVVLDLIMPRMGGDKCLENLLKINPHLKAVVSTGHSLPPKERDRLGARAKGFVNKPYQMKEFLEVVREVLDRE